MIKIYGRKRIVACLKYLIPKEAAEKWGISERRVQLLCQQGRIAGAERHGRIWLIPETAPKPKDARIKTGRYIKNQPESPASEVPDIAPAVQQDGEQYTFLLPTELAAIVPRPRLIEKIAPPGSSLTYIQAGAGYGKTTLLKQYASQRDKVIWLFLDERDSNILCFLRHLEDAFRQKLSRFEFYTTDLLPFSAEDTFVHRALAALLRAIGRCKLTLILDDVHLITDSKVKDLLTRLAQNCPPGLTLVMAGRDELWGELFRLEMDGRVAELTQDDLLFSREETEELWGFFDEDAYVATEGWALALQSYRMAAWSGKLRLPHDDRKLHRYLLEEIFKQLPENMQNFLLATAWLPEPNPAECDRLLHIQNSQEILDELVRRNIFTTQTSPSTYRYHTLFSAFLRQNGNTLGREVLRRAMLDSYARKEYHQAATYALLLDDAAFVHECIDADLGRPFGQGNYGNIRGYFDCMKAQNIELSPRVLLARGLYLSSQGHFHEADQCLREALPMLGEDRRIMLQVLAHKARILRNKASLEESSTLIDSLLPLPADASMEDWYLVMIEKIHNLTLSTRLAEALELTQTMLEKCVSRGNTRVRAWFKRYLTVIYFFKGDYLKCLRYYEKSLSLSGEEQDWLSRHSVGAYAAKAYQATGQEEKAVPLMEAELSRLRRLGLHEELCINYLMYADILLAEEVRKSSQGGGADFSSFHRYLELAEEHAALKGNAQNYILFAKILRLGAELFAQPEKVPHAIKDILQMAEDVTPFFQTIAYGRVASFLHMLGQDMELSKACYRKAIEIGEKHGTWNIPMLCYGGLAAIYLRERDEERAEEYARRFLELSLQYGHRYHFRLKSLFGEVLKFALNRGITPEFTRAMLEYGGYAAQRVYIHTLGAFYIAPVHDRHSRVKIRTQKSRELLAYLLEHREGVSRERIYADLWGDSEGDITGTFHTRRGEIRRAFESLGAKNPIESERGVYRLNMEEIACDYDAFQQAADIFMKDPIPENAQKVVAHYTGRYLDDLEALWAESTRLRCEDTFLQAAEFLLESYRESGERAKTLELLRHCTSLTYQGHRIPSEAESERKKK